MRVKENDIREAAPELPLTWHDLDNGLHVLKDRCRTFPEMRCLLSKLNRELDVAIDATRRLAPRRNQAQGFQIGERWERADRDYNLERQLEWNLFQAFRPGRGSLPEWPGLWSHLLSFQIPLHDNVARDGWGHFDLLGVDYDTLPLVVELKQENSRDWPLRPLLEAAANAIALREVWPICRQEIQEVQGGESPIQLAAEPQNFRLAIVAPTGYWRYLAALAQVTDADWDSLGDLVRRLEERGYPTSFVEIKRNGAEFVVRPIAPPWEWPDLTGVRNPRGPEEDDNAVPESWTR